MKTSFFSVLIISFFVTSVFSQTNLNEYKYVIVSKKYDFLKEADQYQLNSLSKFLFNKYGFEALMEGEKYPADLIKNRCLALKSDAIKDPGMFKTKLTIELIDCNDQVVYTSRIGESREKEFKKAYNEALRNAFKSIEALNYNYEPKEDNTTIVTPKTEVKKDIAIEAAVTKVIVDQSSTGVLYAQEIENGFQLVDSSPKVVYKIMKTGVNEVFLVENQTAIIYKVGDDWVLENSENGSLTRLKLNIKF